MLRSTLLVTLTAAAALAGTACTKDSAATSQSSAMPKDAEARMARLEKRIDKIQEVLEKVLPPAEADPEATYSVPVDPMDELQCDSCQ